MKLLRWMLSTPYPYVALAIPLYVLVMGYGWGRVILTLILSAGIFISAAWVNYRRDSVVSSAPSIRESQTRARMKWPAKQYLGNERYAAGVSMAAARVKGHVLLFVPDGDGAWHCARMPSRWQRGVPHVVEFSTYDAMVAELEREGVGYIPRSPYARSVVDSLSHRLALRGITHESIASGSVGTRVVGTLAVTGAIAHGGPPYAEFDRRVPTRAEADWIVAEGLGVALRRVPRESRDLAFLEWLPDLRGLWIHGAVDPSRIGQLSALTHLSLLSAGSRDVDLSDLEKLEFYEGELQGRESVLALPALKELYLGRVGDGQLDRVPPSVQCLSLHGATDLGSLGFVTAATGLRELEVLGP